MAVQDSSLGLKKLEIADVSAIGLPTKWLELEDIKTGSAVMSDTEATINEIYVEQRASVYRSTTSQEGVTTLKFDIYDVSPENLSLLKGGEVSGKTWKGGKNSININKAVRVTTLDDYEIVIPNGRVVAVFNWALNKEELASISVTITAQAPLDDTLGAVEITAP